MSFGSGFFKKQKGQWHYYPFGPAVKEISMPVKDGEKEFFESALNKEMYFALALPPIVIGLAQISPYIPLILLVLVPAMVFRRKHLEKKHCDFIPYPKFYFFRNYFKIVVPYISDDMIKKDIFKLSLFSIFLFIGSFGIYMKEGFSFWFFVIFLAFLFSILPFYLIFLKKINNQK